MEIKEEQQRQWAVLKELQAKVQGQAPCEEEEEEALDLDLPLRTMEQLDQAERQLEDAAAQKRMVKSYAGSQMVHLCTSVFIFQCV